MQKLKRIPHQHFFVKAPESAGCIVRAPNVPDPTITRTRMRDRLETVYAALPCYTRVLEHAEPNDGDDTHRADAVLNHDDDDVIDVEVNEVHAPEPTTALPSPAPVDAPADAEVEAGLWQRWTNMGRGLLKKS
jgi:hypothetical protein